MCDRPRRSDRTPTWMPLVRRSRGCLPRLAQQAHQVDPWAGGVDQHAAPRHQLVAVDVVAHRDPRHAPVLEHEAGRLGVIGDHRAETGGRLRDLHDQARIVGEVLVVEPRSVHMVRAQHRLQGDRLLLRQHAVALFVRDAGEPIVGPQPDADLGVAAAAADRDQHLPRAGQVRRQLAQRVALGRRLANQADVALLQVAQAAVHELGGAAAGAAGEVAALDQPDRQPAQRRVARHPGTGDPAADDQHVEGLVGQAPEVPGAGLRRELGEPGHDSQPISCAASSLSTKRRWGAFGPLRSCRPWPPAGSCSSA